MNDQLSSAPLSSLLGLMPAAPAIPGAAGTAPQAIPMPFGALLAAQPGMTPPATQTPDGQTLPPAGGLLPQAVTGSSSGASAPLVTTDQPVLPSMDMPLLDQAVADGQDASSELMPKQGVPQPSVNVAQADVGGGRRVAAGVVIREQWAGLSTSRTPMNLEQPEVVSIIQGLLADSSVPSGALDCANAQAGQAREGGAATEFVLLPGEGSGLSKAQSKVELYRRLPDLPIESLTASAGDAVNELGSPKREPSLLSIFDALEQEPAMLSAESHRSEISSKVQADTKLQLETARQNGLVEVGVLESLVVMSPDAAHKSQQKVIEPGEREVMLAGQSQMEASAKRNSGAVSTVNLFEPRQGLTEIAGLAEILHKGSGTDHKMKGDSPENANNIEGNSDAVSAEGLVKPQQFEIDFSGAVELLGYHGAASAVEFQADASNSGRNVRGIRTANLVEQQVVFEADGPVELLTRSDDYTENPVLKTQQGHVVADGAVELTHEVISADESAGRAAEAVSELKKREVTGQASGPTNILGERGVNAGASAAQSAPQAAASRMSADMAQGLDAGARGVAGEVVDTESNQRSERAADVIGANLRNDAGAGLGEARSGTASTLNTTALGEAAARMSPTEAQLSMAGRGPMGSPGWQQGLSERVMVMTAKNSQVAEIQLDPPELGSLKVRVHVGQDQVSVTFSSPHANVRDAVEQSLPRLREMMEEQGLSLGDSSVSDQGSGDEKDEQDGGRRFGSSDSSAASEQPAQTVMIDGEAVSLVDYYA